MLWGRQSFIVIPVLALVYGAVIVAWGTGGRAVGVVVPIVCALVIGSRRRFAALHLSDVVPHSAVWIAVWVLAITTLLAVEVWQVLHGETTVTSLVVPFLAIPVVRVVALAVWVRLGWALAR